MAYTPENAPASYDQQWIQKELHKIREAMFSPQPFEYLEQQHVAPIKPRDGMIVLADGVNWNPGAGAGYYGYLGGSWIPLFGQRFADCRLDGGTAANSFKLSRFKNGRLITCGNRTLEIPAAGIEVVPTAAANATIYNVYAYPDSNGALAVEWNTTATTIDAATNARVKTGTTDHQFVGMFRKNGSGQLLDTFAERGIASWFNPIRKAAQASFSLATAAQSPAVAATINMLGWSGRTWAAGVEGRGNPNVAGTNLFLDLFVNGSQSVGTVPVQYGANLAWYFIGSKSPRGMFASDSWAYFQAMVYTSGNTPTFVGNLYVETDL